MTIKRITFLQELLEFVGLGGRVHLEWISSAEAQKFVQVVKEFTEKIRHLGPNPLRGFRLNNMTLDSGAVAGTAEKTLCPLPEQTAAQN
jgi:F420-non-reducing hydrogenase iron-sulfur subunit